MYYFNDVTLNIRCHRSCPISATTLRVSEEHWSGVQIRGCGVGRGLQVTFGGGGGLEQPLEGVLGEVLGWKEHAVVLGTAGRGLE